MIGIASLAVLTAASNMQAGAPAAVTSPPPNDKPGDWCEWLSSKPGTVYKGDNAFLQELNFFGRFQWQAAYVMGEDVNGYDFSDDYTEVRRFRLGLQAKFLNYFKLKANVNLVDDKRPSGGDLGWGYEDFDEACISFNAAKAFGISSLDSLDIGYGRFKHVLSYEAHQSSKKLLTVERSAISNKVYDSYRPTGLKLSASKGPWEFVTALYSTDEPDRRMHQVDFIGGWNDGLAYYGAVGFEATDELSFLWDFLYNDADALQGDDSIFEYKWATSLSAHHDAGPWGVITDLIYGDNGGPGNGNTRAARQGDFWGLVIMPYYWFIEDKLQGVVRYQYAGSQNINGIRTNSRYFRRDHGSVVDVNSGRGNELHTIYAGVNYYLCGHNLKVQAGVEHEWLNAPQSGPAGDASATTLWFAFRSYF